MYVLTELERSGESHIASWLPHGRSFKVYNRTAFVEKVLPCWFRQHSFASFQRQLNIYGFTRIASGLDNDAYYHANFLRGQPDLVRGIPRMAVKGPRQSAVPPSSHPNFYIMAPLALNKDNVNAPTSRQASLVNAALPSDASIEANALEAVSLSGPPDLASPWTEFATVVNDGRAQALSMPLLPTPSFLLELYSQRERDAPQELERRRQQDKQVQNAADLWNVLQNQTPTQVHAPAQFRATEEMQSTANLGTMSTLQQLRLHQLANRHGSTVATIQQPQQHPHSRPARHVNTTVLDRFQAALHPRQQSDAMAVSSGQVSLAQAALTVARSRVESNRRGDNDGSSWLDRNALDVAMLLHGQATTEQLLRSALLNQQQQQQQQQHDNGTGIRAYLHQTPSLGVVDRYSTFPLNDVETIRRLDEHASNINPTAVAPLGTLSHLSVPMSQAERLQQLLDHRADAMLQRRAAATLPVDSHGPSASAIVGRGGGGSESEPLVAMTATAAPPVIFGRAEQVNIENASTTCTDAHLQAINQALSNDDERKPQARRPY